MRRRPLALRRSPGLRLALSLCTALLMTLVLGRAFAQDKEPPPREARFVWDEKRRLLRVSVSYRDVVDDRIQKKLTRGLPTTIVMTAAVYQNGVTEPISTTTQTCKITWLVWDEVYKLEIIRPGGSRVEKTLTLKGVLRRCAEARVLLAGTRAQIPFGVALFLKARVLVNPISEEILQKIKRWVSRPTGTGTAAPGDALFSTFTGLFLQRIGEAERELKFSTKPSTPTVQKPKQKK